MCSVTEPCTNFALRFGITKALCVVAENSGTLQAPSAGASALHAVLRDAQRRFAVLGGRPGMPRSLGSVYAAFVVLFTGSFFELQRTQTLPRFCKRVTITRDGCTLLAVDAANGMIYAYRVADGALLQTVGSSGSGLLQFCSPGQVYVASDDHVLVADAGNNRVQELTPRLEFHRFVGAGHVFQPRGVCADDTLIVVSENLLNRISVFTRFHGALVRRFDCEGSPAELCFTPDHDHIVVGTTAPSCVTVFTLDGTAVRRVGVDTLVCPGRVAYSAFGELLVVDCAARLFVFGAHNDRPRIIVYTGARDVALHAGAVYVLCPDRTCAVFA